MFHIVILLILLIILVYAIKNKPINPTYRTTTSERIIAGGSGTQERQSGLLYTYRFVKSNGISERDQQEFETQSREILRNSGWNEKHAIKEDPIGGQITIKLVPAAEMDKKRHITDKDDNGEIIRFSYTYQTPNEPPLIEIDELNWKNGVPRSKMSLKEYREYVINHEFGHALGYDHQECPNLPSSSSDSSPFSLPRSSSSSNSHSPSESCPVMYQSTRGHKTRRCGYKVTRFDDNLMLRYRFARWRKI